jgi:hypothetical protein
VIRCLAGVVGGDWGGGGGGGGLGICWGIRNHGSVGGVRGTKWGGGKGVSCVILVRFEWGWIGLGWGDSGWLWVCSMEGLG